MISLLKHLRRFIMSLCITVAVIFLMACVIAVVYFIAKGDIKICRLNEDDEME